MSAPLSRIVPAVGSSSRMTQFADGRLAAARLADEPEHLACGERERHAVDRVARLRRHAQPPRPSGKCLTSPSTSSTGTVVAHRGPGWKQATSGRAGTSRSSGTSDHEARPLAGSGRRRRSRPAARASDGTRRGSPGAARCAADPGRGTAPSRPIVYGCCGCANSSSTGALLDLAAGVHHHHAVGDVGDDAEVVGDQDDRGPEPARELAQQVEDPRLDRHVERRRRLVGDQHLRVAGERHRDHHALPHPARELVRVLVDAPLRGRDARPGPAARSPARRAPRCRERPRCSPQRPRRSGGRP